MTPVNAHPYSVLQDRVLDIAEAFDDGRFDTSATYPLMRAGDAYPLYMAPIVRSTLTYRLYHEVSRRFAA